MKRALFLLGILALALIGLFFALHREELAIDQENEREAAQRERQADEAVDIDPIDKSIEAMPTEADSGNSQ